MTREELYRKFGPMLIEAIVLVIKDEINILRDEAGLPLRDNEEVRIAISNKLENIAEYLWIGE